MSQKQKISMIEKIEFVCEECGYSPTVNTFKEAIAAAKGEYIPPCENKECKLFMVETKK